MNRSLGELLQAPSVTRSVASHPSSDPTRTPAGRASVMALTTAARKPATKSPLVIGHRGAAGYRPEHTRPPLVQQVRSAGLDRANAPIFIQSFELTNLVHLRQHFGVNAMAAA